MLLKIAFRNLIQARRRTALLSLALFMVTVFFVFLLALSAGISESMLSSATTMASGHVNVAGFYKSRPSDASPIVSEKSKVRAIIAKNVEGLQFMVDRSRGWARIISETASLNAGLTGIDIAEEQMFAERIQLAPQADYLEGGVPEILGRFEGLKKKDHCMIFEGQARRLGVDVGDRLTISVESFSGARNTGEFTVAAVAKDVGFMSNWSVFAEKQSINALYQLHDDVTGSVQIFLDDVDRAPEVMESLRGVFAKAGYRIMDHDPRSFFMKFEPVSGEDWTGQKLDLTIWSDEISYLEWVLGAVNGVSFFLVLILVVIIAFGIANSMWMSVRERTQEVGTLRAIGMHRKSVLGLFVLEALMLGALATGLGVLLGGALMALIDRAAFKVPVDAVQMILLSDTLHLVVHPSALVWTVLGFSALAGAAAFFPALKASRASPVTAIQHTS